MADRFRIEVDDSAVRLAFAGMIARGEDMSPAMDTIGGMLVASTQRRFELGAGPDQVPWKVSERAKREGGRTLIDSNRLWLSITHDFGPDWVEAGSNVVYAAIHQRGGRAGRGHAVELPPRPFLGVDREDAAEIPNILADHVIGGGA